MKHLKELKLNENIINEINPESVKNFIAFKNSLIGDLIEDYEFTDLFFDKKEVKDKLDEATKKILDYYDSTLKELYKDFESEFPLNSPAEPKEKEFKPWLNSFDKSMKIRDKEQKRLVKKLGGNA